MPLANKHKKSCHHLAALPAGKADASHTQSAQRMISKRSILGVLGSLGRMKKGILMNDDAIGAASDVAVARVKELQGLMVREHGGTCDGNKAIKGAGLQTSHDSNVKDALW